MDLHFPEHLKKILFWQRVALATLTVFLTVIWAAALYYFSEWIGYLRTSSGPMHSPIEFLFFAFWACVLITFTAIDYILYQSIAALQKYLNVESDMRYLEIAFRKQRQFWMGFVLLVLAGVVVVVFVLFLAVAAF